MVPAYGAYISLNSYKYALDCSLYWNFLHHYLLCNKLLIKTRVCKELSRLSFNWLFERYRLLVKKLFFHLRTDEERWCWWLFCGSKLPIVSPWCLTTALCTIKYLNNLDMQIGFLSCICYTHDNFFVTKIQHIICFIIHMMNISRIRDICECWYFTHMWKRVAWLYYFTEKEI